MADDSSLTWGLRNRISSSKLANPAKDPSKSSNTTTYLGVVSSQVRRSADVRLMIIRDKGIQEGCRIKLSTGKIWKVKYIKNGMIYVFGARDGINPRSCELVVE